jgi:hypothetical protein
MCQARKKRVKVKAEVEFLKPGPNLNFNSWTGS